MSELIQHMKRVAKDDVRLFFAPFVGAVDAIKKEIDRTNKQVKTVHQKPRVKLKR